MLDAIGSEMLKMLNFGTTVPGAITAEDLPRALDNLQTTLAAIPVDDAEEIDEDNPPVSLQTRALPLQQLIEATIADGEHLRWD